MNDTPETDAIAEMAHNLVLDWDCRDRGDTTEKPVVVPAEFARRLERERDEARKDAAMWKSNHDNQVELKSIISKRGDLKDRAPRVEKLIAERDKAISRFEALQEFCETELGWMYFRAEFLESKADSPSKTIENAQALQAYLKELK
jgi:hypothetical protein